MSKVLKCPKLSGPEWTLYLVDNAAKVVITTNDDKKIELLVSTVDYVINVPQFLNANWRKKYPNEEIYGTAVFFIHETFTVIKAKDIKKFEVGREPDQKLIDYEVNNIVDGRYEYDKEIYKRILM